MRPSDLSCAKMEAICKLGTDQTEHPGPICVKLLEPVV
jgi:hypothetical protein